MLYCYTKFLLLIIKKILVNSCGVSGTVYYVDYGSNTLNTATNTGFCVLTCGYNFNIFILFLYIS